MTRTGSTTHVISIRLCRPHITIVMLVLMVSGCATRKPAVVTPPPVAPRTSAEPLTFTATAYCTGHVTATGTSVSAGVVAADPAVLPMGTVIRITGAAPYDGSYRVLDTGGRVRNHHVDLYIADCAAARRFGRRSVRVTVLEPAR
ncbi:MAG TPA: 3D domain-containing protein [Tepidisphaeraceae bacterium]|nr:3D domain-containing protein [Tepidisphaeraceae bacterium]